MVLEEIVEADVAGLGRGRDIVRCCRHEEDVQGDKADGKRREGLDFYWLRTAGFCDGKKNEFEIPILRDKLISNHTIFLFFNFFKKHSKNAFIFKTKTVCIVQNKPATYKRL